MSGQRAVVAERRPGAVTSEVVLGAGSTRDGFSEGKLRRLVDRVAEYVDAGPSPSAQLAVARDGVVVLEAAVGSTLATAYTCFSVTKPIVSAAIWQLVAAGRLEIHRPVSHYIPEFAAEGKAAVTVEHLLLHTCGFPSRAMPPEVWNDRPGRVREFCSWQLEWAPGTAFAYHPTSAHWVLGELIARVSDVGDHRLFVRERVLRPAGAARASLGRPEGEQDGIAAITWGGARGPAQESLAATGQVPEPPEIAYRYNLRYNDSNARAAGVPSSGLIATAADVALFYQALMRNPGGMWDADLLRAATSQVRNDFCDPHLGVPAQRTLGLMVMGPGRSVLRHVYGQGPSDRAFGHHGVGGQIAWADPDTGVSFSYLTNGFDADLLRLHQRRRTLCDLASDLLA